VDEAALLDAYVLVLADDFAIAEDDRRGYRYQIVGRGHAN
jgi:hypothetical protein